MGLLQAVCRLQQLQLTTINVYLPHMTQCVRPAWNSYWSTCSSAASLQTMQRAYSHDHACSRASMSQERLIQQLLEAGKLTERAAAALQAVDRQHFVKTYAGVPGSVAYQDTALPISCGQTMPAFSVHAQMLSLLEPFVQPGAAVLDLGAGSGYMAACLAQLSGPSGTVLALEKQAKLVDRARLNLQASIPGLCQTVSVRVCNVMAGPPELQQDGKYDAIHIGGSLQEIPRFLVQLLRPGGRLVLPLGAMHGAAPQVLVALDKGPDASLTQQQHGALTTRIQPLTKSQDDDIWTQ